MATISVPRRLANPARRRKRNPKRMSLAQRLHFGSKAQRRAAAKSLSGRRTNAGKRNRRKPTAVRQKRHSSRVGNVGEILIVRRKNSSMARKRRKVNASRHRTRRVNASHRPRRRRSNPIVVFSPRRRNPSRRVHHRRRNTRRVHHRRRNPGLGGLGVPLGNVFGVIGGAAVTSFLMSKVVPSGFNSGFPGYIAAGVIALLQGKVIGMVSKSPSAGANFAIGGFTYLALKILSDMGLASSLGIGLSGLGLIGPSSFYVPQVNTMGSMGSFVRPSMVPTPYVPPAASGMSGLNEPAAVGRRMSARRVGRLA